LPKSVKEALRIDEEMKTSFWGDAIKKEMGSNIIPALHILDPDEHVPVGSQFVPCHIVFDVKMDFTREARFIAGGHVTDPPMLQTYASVVSLDSVRIAFLLASLDGLDILSADVQGAYLNAPCKERVHTICVDEFGQELKGRIAVIVKALMGLRQVHLPGEATLQRHSENWDMYHV
jgi:Reverse transcriptase (RNA-dependent DNA polymerase)